MRAWRRFVIVLVIAATAALFYRWWQTASSKAQRRVLPAAANDEPESAAEATAGPSFPTRENTADASAQRAGPKLDRAQADRMRQAIRALLIEAGALGLAGEPLDAATSAPAPTFGSMPVIGLDEAGNPKVDPKYIEARVHEDLFPLALDCYTDALKRSPRLAGKLNVYFRVIGDHKVGGVVDEAKLLDGTTIDDPEMQTCVRESMMSVSFDAPPQDGELTVIYPIEFSPDEADGN